MSVTIGVWEPTAAGTEALDTDIEMLSSSQPTKVGGVQFGFGARLRF